MSSKIRATRTARNYPNSTKALRTKKIAELNAKWKIANDKAYKALVIASRAMDRAQKDDSDYVIDAAINALQNYKKAKHERGRISLMIDRLEKRN